MNGSVKTVLKTTIASFALSVFIGGSMLYLEAWGDGRYELKDEAIRKEIRRIDTQLSIKDTEILFAETPREKEKLKAIKAVYERDKEALTADLNKT